MYIISYLDTSSSRSSNSSSSTSNKVCLLYLTWILAVVEVVVRVVVLVVAVVLVAIAVVLVAIAVVLVVAVRVYMCIISYLDTSRSSTCNKVLYVHIYYIKFIESLERSKQFSNASWCIANLKT